MMTLLAISLLRNNAVLQAEIEACALGSSALDLRVMMNKVLETPGETAVAQFQFHRAPAYLGYHPHVLGVGRVDFGNILRQGSQFFQQALHGGHARATLRLALLVGNSH